MSASVSWIFLLLVLIIILFFKTGEIKQRLTQRIEQLEQLVQQFRIRLQYLEKEFRQEAGKKGESQAEKPSEGELAVKKPEIKPVVVPEIRIEPERAPRSVAPPSFSTPSADEPKQPEPAPAVAVETDGIAAVSLTSRLFNKWKSAKGNIDWEQFTGTKLFAWLGGLALFIGAGFFVKYSIDRNLIPPIVRLVIGAITGTGMIIAAFRFQRGRFDIMRHTLTAGGVGVLYTVIFAATPYYHYLPAVAGFCCLIVISAAAFVLAVYHQGLAISILGAIGAYSTPILVRTGANNLFTLWIYLTVINIGLDQVVLRLKSIPLLLIATTGTLILLCGSSFFISPHPAAGTIAGVWIANMALFSAFFIRTEARPDGNRPLLWSGIILYANVLGTALALMLDRSGCAPMLLITAAVTGAVCLSLNKEGWSRLVIPYTVCTFAAAVLWTWLRFSPNSDPWYFLLFLAYGVSGGLGPILLIKKYGAARSFLNWFKIFPAAITGLSLVVLFKNPQISFWFWPMIICLQVVGIIASLLVRAVYQIGILTIFLMVSGLVWLHRTPPELIGFGFYGLILTSGAILCVTIFYVIYKLPGWVSFLRMDSGDQGVSQSIPLTQWMAAAPVMGAFVLLAAAFITQRPLNPHPGMATLVCFLILALSLCRRLSFQPIGMVTLFSSVIAQAAWMMNTDNTIALYFSTFVWADVLFLCALVVPFIVYPSYERWKNVWMSWAFFEVSQALFIIWGADHLWERGYSGWLPMLLAALKLPGVAVLIKQLQGKAERNAVLACHGGVLLFYVSAVPIMLLDQGWIGLTLVIEAAALLWLNRRIEHPGLRWVSTIIAPTGLFLLLSYLPSMNGPESLIILNPAIMTTAACVIALAFAVRLSSSPRREPGKIDLPVYFLWLAVGTAFYLANLMVADVFSDFRTGYDLMPTFYVHGDLLRSICSSLLWAGFGAVLWRIGRLPQKMRLAGMIIFLLGTGWLIIFPMLHLGAVAEMRPLINMGLLAYLPLMAILFYLYLKEPSDYPTKNIKNLFLALLLIAGFMCLALEKSTVFQTGHPFSIIFNHTLSMGAASAAVWVLYGLGMLIWPKKLDRPFRLAGLVLLMLGLMKAGTLPFEFKDAFGALKPLLNAPTVLYLGCLGLLIFFTFRREDENWPIKEIPSRQYWFVVLMLLAFYTMNIEIASAFGMKGRPFSLMTHGSLSHQLGYSLGWMIFSIGMLVVGIKWDIVKVRWASLILLVVTSLKIFFKDLWVLGQLYRVASFIGLAVVLILVSFLYQRYLSDRGKNAD